MANERTRNGIPPTAYESSSEERNISDTLNQVNGRLTNLYQSQTSYTSTNYSLNALQPNGTIFSKNRMFQVRRTFLLIVTFDLIFTSLLWIIYNQILNIPIDEAFQKEVINYTLKSSLFDVVGLSGIRFILLMVPYAILKWSHWIFAAFTTLSSTGFIIAKTCVFTIARTDKSFTDYIILIVSFILAWVEIWFFDYRVIPHERRLREALNHGERRPLLPSYGSGSISPNPSLLNNHIIPILHEHPQSFYSPIHSVDGSDTEETRQEPLRSVRSDSNVSQSMLGTPRSTFDDHNNDEEYVKQADEMVTDIWRMFKDKTSWSQEAKSKDGFDIVVSKTFPKWGRVYRLISTIKGNRTDLLEVLFERQEEIAKWSTTVNDCRILEMINNDLYITYQLTNEQAQGMIAKRDFVNLAARRYIDDVAILVAQACLYPRMPPKENCVRAENGPTAYILEKIDDTTCKLTFLLNVDLKGWLPQYLINSSLANVQLGLVESLRNYISKTIDITSSSSSSIGDNTT